jgi:hypothetical protein
MTTPDEPDLERLRPLYVLDILSPRLRSDVLADGEIAEKCDIRMKHPMQIGEGIVVLREQLFAALRSAVDGLPIAKLLDQNNADIDIDIEINPDGSGTFTSGERKFRFPFVTLLSSEPQKRFSAFDNFLERFPINESAAASLRTLVQRSHYRDEDFISIVTMLESSPEMFCERLREKTRPKGQEGRLSVDDLLPDDIHYWDHLIALPRQSSTLAEYLENELKEARQARLAKGANYALHSMALTFGAPALVPHALMQELRADALAPILESLCEVDDHFSLLGAYEICAGRFTEDQRFVAIGERLLDRLFAEKDRLKAACALFGAVFVVTTAHLAEHETLGRHPVYWRRLAAVAHASLVVRICESSGIKPEEISAWAMRVAGEAYFLSVLSDFAVEPQWRPEWIVTHFLVADAFGRANGTLHRIDLDKAPPTWKQKIDKAHEWIVEENLDPFTQYPAVLEGTRRAKLPTLAEFALANFALGLELYGNLKSDPSPQNLLAVSPLIEALGLPPEAAEDVGKVLDAIRKEPGIDGDDRLISVTLSLIAHIAALTQNNDLADGVADIFLNRARSRRPIGPIIETVARLVECSSVLPDREAARRTLVRRLEILSFVLPSSEALSDLTSTVTKLARLQPELAPRVGKVIAASRLGIPRPSAA